MSDVEHFASTFATRLTTAAPAAIAVIELSGPTTEIWLQQCWQPATVSPRQIGVIRFGSWAGVHESHSEDGTKQSLRAPEDVVVCWTSCETVEIHCHGGKQAATRILNDLKSLGAVPRSTHSRLEHQIPDQYVAAALVDLEKTTTEMTTAILLDQVRGAFSRSMAEIRQLLGQNDKRKANAKIEELLVRWQYGAHLTQPWRLAIIGPPNAGKSSLLNAILGYDRAIVDMQAGTTRDALTEQTSLHGWPFVIVDTAGLRDTLDSIEREGVERALKATKASDLVLLIVEPRQGWTAWHDAIYYEYSSKCVAVHSKSDLGLPLPAIPSNLSAICVSAQTRTGIEAMYETIIARLIPTPPQLGQAVPFRKAQVPVLEEWLRMKWH